MSQPSEIERQVAELKAFGVPVKTGVPAFRGNSPTKEAAASASDQWLHRWAKHACQNYDRVHDNVGVRFLADCALGIPAFVVGVGPSLDEVIPKLREACGRAIILSTDAAYRALLAHGIVPDIVISFDCKQEQSLLWKDIPEYNTACLFDTCAHPEAIQSWKGPVLFYNHWHQHDEFSSKLLPYIFPHVGQLPSAGTVGNMGVLAAKLFGCSPVFSVGMDFCYKLIEDGWQYRARDYEWDLHVWVPTEIKPLYDNDTRVRRSFLLDVGTKTYRIDPELEVYHRAFLNVVKQYQINVINLSPGSRLQDNFETLTVEKAIDTHCKTVLQGGRTVLKHLDKIVGRVH
jgi:hypothetical protein